MIDHQTDRVIEMGPEYELHFADNPGPSAIELGWVGEFADGQWVYLSDLAALVRAFRHVARRKAVGKLGFQEWIFPRLQSVSSIEPFGWMEHEELASELLLARENIADQQNAPARYVLDPLQCPSFYEYLRGKRIQDRDLPLKVFEVLGGWTYRNEDKRKLCYFATSIEFLGAEFVYLGTPRQVMDARLATLGAVTEIMDFLQLRWRTVVGHSCVQREESEQGHNQLGEPQTLDIQCYLPFIDSWIEIGGGDLHHATLVRAFRIEAESGKELWSGCQGLGFGRLAYAFLAQRGFDRNKWPKGIQTHV